MEVNVISIRTQTLMVLLAMIFASMVYSPIIVAADLSWEEVVEAASYQFQLGEDVNFTKVKVDRQVEKNFVELPALAPGKYFWRVRVKKKGENSFGPFSDTGSVNISALAPISTAPASLSFTPNQAPEFRLSWKNQSLYNSKNFILETSLQKDFSSFKTHKVSAPALIIPALDGEKQIYWRVANANNEFLSQGEVSSIFSQTLIYENQAEKIKIIFPVNNYIFYYSLRPDGEGQRINASWTPIKNAKSYILQVGKDKQFKELYHERNTRDENLDYMPGVIKEPTSYYLRIRAVLPEGVLSDWSEAYFVSHRPMKDGQIIPLRPAQGEIVMVPDTHGDVEFQWTGNDAQNAYCLTLCKDQKCQKKMVKLVSKNKHRLRLASEKIYAWSVINAQKGKCLAPKLPKLQEIITFKTTRQNVTNRFGLDIFYTASMGTFNEILQHKGKEIHSSSTQTSPLTLGGAVSWRPLGQKYSANASFYLSYLNGSQLSDGQKADIPPEVGINSYVNYPLAWQNVFVYSGLDIENFANYNIDEVYFGKALKARSNYLFYATLGAFKLFPWGSNNFFLKSSVSKSLVSFAGEKSTIDESASFSGLKYMLYLNWSNPQLLGKFNLHFLLKSHQLTGPTELGITRIGIGVGYKLF